ncbi:MAG: hypothetical protein JWR14_1799 [Caballeronia sp.]|jgi:hypothetical protein|nr:hypothetical protein [Caballeronia sp.]
MTIPTAVFLDTSIFAGQQYIFDSSALSTFVPIAKRELAYRLTGPINLRADVRRYT